MNEQLIFSCKNICKITQELKSLYDYVYLDDKDIENLKTDKDSYLGMVIDCSFYKEEESKLKSLINTCNESGWAVILLNIDEKSSVANCLGFSIPAKCLLFRNYDKYKVFNILETEDEPTHLMDKNNPTFNKTPQCLYKSYFCEDVYYNNYCNSSCYSDCSKCANYKGNNNINNMYKVPYKDVLNKSIPHKIKNILSKEYELPANSILNKHTFDSERIASKRSNAIPRASITSLPKEQYEIIYVELDLQESISTQQPQIVNNSTTLEISLIASYNPKYKYLQLRTLGSGLNPGRLLSNVKCDRKWFQNTINISAKPSNDRLSILSTEPKNINNLNYYETYSVLRVGVNVSMFPGFFSSYEIISKETSTVSDFTITNNTFLNKAQWEWQLSITKDNVENIFAGGRAFRNSYIRILPPLAISNLQPVTDTVWYISSDFNDKITLDVRFAIQYLSATIKPNRVFGRKLFYTKEIDDVDKFYSKRVSIDFSTVYA